MVGLTQTKIKNARAEAHLKSLETAITAFLSEPVTIAIKDDVEKGLHIRRFEMKIIPEVIPLLIGEWAYNLRSGLDQLAWQLALLSGRTPSSQTAFPIHKDRMGEKRFLDATRFIPDEAVQVIQLLQPYNRGKDFDRHPLWRVNKICNLDKHTTMAINSTLTTFDYGPGEYVDLFSKVPLDYGVEVIIPLTIKDNIYVDPRTPQLIFGRPIDEPGPAFEFTYVDITEIHHFVRDEVVPRFERFFA